MTRLPSRLRGGYSAWVDGADLVLRFGAEDVVFTWFHALPITDPLEALSVSLDLHERMKQDRFQRALRSVDLEKVVLGAAIEYENPASHAEIGHEDWQIEGTGF